MTITANNYVAHAQRAIDGALRSPMCNDPDWPNDRLRALHVQELLTKAQRFSLPDGAVLFEDDLRGIRGQRVRLPFPVIALEYFVPPDTALTPEAPVYVPKVVVVAAEVSLGKHNGEERCAIEVFSFYETHDGWIPNPSGFVISDDWDEYAKASRIAALASTPSTRPGVVGRVCPLFEQVAKAASTRLGPQRAEVEFGHNIGAEVGSVLAFCEAMSCSNVGTIEREGASAAVNARRIKAGKLPLLSSRILTVDVPGQARGARLDLSAGMTGGVRQHLRRGHIRRLDDKRRIWINSCVVGNPEKGRVEKSYRVTAEGVHA